MIKKLFKIKMVLFLFAFSYKNIFSESNTWKGSSLKLISGSYLKFVDMTDMDPDSKKGIGFLAGWGFEHNFNINKNRYLSLEVSFPYYDDIFQGEDINSAPIFGRFTFKRAFLLAIPIIKMNYGFELRDDLMFSIGSAYLWGITARFRKKLSPNITFDTEVCYFLDRWMSSDGLHDIHILFSFSYIFNN